MPKSAEHCNKVSIGLTGKTRTTEARARQSASLQGRLLSETNKARIGAARERLNARTIQSLLVNTGKVRDIAARERISLGRLAAQLTPGLSGLRGVSPAPWAAGKWQARIKLFGGSRLFLGTFETKEAAHQAYLAAAAQGAAA